MRVIETIHPNLQCRTFTCDQILSKVRISSLFCFTENKETAPEALKLYDQLSDIPLLKKDIMIDRYSISLKIEEAFEDNKEDWSNIRDAVFYCLANFFKISFDDVEKAHSIKDNRKKYREEVIDFIRLQEVIEKIKIPHDFATHRIAWRNAIVIAKVTQENHYKTHEPEFPTGKNSYWKNELDKFDTAFEALLALKLPQD